MPQFQIQKLFFVLLAINAICLIGFYSRSSQDLASTSTETNQNLVTQSEFMAKPKGKNNELTEAQNQLKEINKILKEAKAELEQIYLLKNDAVNNINISKGFYSPKTLFKPLVDPKAKTPFSRLKNPFFVLGAYPKVEIQVPYENRLEVPIYDKVLYGNINDDDYCERVDYYNLAHPENIFENKVFFTDYVRNSVPRQDVIPSIGRNVWTRFNKRGAHGHEKRRLYHFDTSINTFFMNMDGFQIYHEIGKHFLCATQMFNHIPGQRALIRKDDLVEAISRYTVRFDDKPQCFNGQMFFPYSYRLYNETECNTFFEHINSLDYISSLKDEPIQFILKVGHGSHSANGVSLLDQGETDRINKKYDSGNKCGTIKLPNIAQVYVTDPLLLDMNNKFDFRVYMLVASTDPLIVYYHDGFLRATLSAYDKFSHERGKHLTNTHLAEDIFREAQNKKINGMTEKQLRDYHIWSFEELEEYLLESGKITDSDWLENHLRPQFRKAMIHLVKMTSEFFLKQNNIYGLYGLDFMLDTQFNLWFIEANPNPQLLATSDFLGELLNNLLRSLFDIEYGLYKSRMQRVLKVIQRMNQDQKNGKVDIAKYKQEYKLAAKNRFEPEFEVSSDNSFTLVMNEYLSGSAAYLGNIDPVCAEPYQI